MIDGDLRSAVHGKDATLLAGLELSEEQLDYLTHRGWSWMAPACVWRSEGEQRRSLWCIDEEEWSVSVAGLVLATHETFDIQACQHEWSTKPARDVFHIWEEWANEAIEAGDLDAKHRDAPRRAIEVKEAWCRGEASDLALKFERDAARAARDAADPAAGSAANAAAWSAANAAAWSAANAAAWSAANAAARSASAARSARDAARSARDAWDAAYETYCEEFTAHVLTCLKDKKHAIAK